jgi:hypothetical protein
LFLSEKEAPKMRRFLFVFYIFNNVRYLARKDEAKGVNGFGGDGFVVLHAVEGTCGKSLFKNKMVLGYVLFKECFVEWFIAYHRNRPDDKNNILYILTIL